MVTTTITANDIRKYRNNFLSNITNKIVQNSVCTTAINDLAINRQLLQSHDPQLFTTKLDDWTVTNQKSSGRCWLFATLNLFRKSLLTKLNVKDYELSQSYIHFWDKFERSNCFLESIIETSNRHFDDRTVSYLLGDPIGDGGQWNMATNLIRKHGLVPKTAFPETHSSSNTMWMNAILKDILRSSACEIRTLLESGATIEEARAHKEKRVEDIWRVLCIHLGTPPEEFRMQWKDKDGVIHDKGMITPTQFATDFIDVDWENYVCIVNDPRNPTMQLYTVDYLQNVIGGPPVIYLNLPSSDMKAITRKLLEDGNPVWMGCDVGKQFDRTNGLWDLNIFEYENLYNVKFGMNKANRLRFRQTLMTHAMLFTGVHVENDQPVKWRVENSWGETGGVKGFYTMNDNWYDEHMFEIACPKSYLTEEMLQVFSTQPTVLPAWDPMGSLAREEALLSDSSTSDLHVKL